MHKAASSPNEHTLRLLLAAGADVTRHGRRGRTALHEAAGAYDVYVAAVAVLLDAGADVNAQDRRGRTPLDEANRIQKSWLEDLRPDQDDLERMAAVIATLREAGGISAKD